MKLKAVLVLFTLPFISTTAFGAMLEANFSESEGQKTIELSSGIDDSHLRNPPGYFPSEPPIRRIVKRIIITNTGQLSISNPDVRVNGRPLLAPFDPLTALECPDSSALITLLAAWQDRFIHATTDLEAGRDPTAALQVFGAAFCGENTRALAAISANRGNEVRFVQLNGHSVAEHCINSRWTILDGDQHLFYLDWDNHSAIGEAEILADPLLSLRTQTFGRQATWKIDAAWQNTSRFEFVRRSGEVKKFRLKNIPPTRNWELRPGEKLIIDLTQSPKWVYAANEELRSNATLRSAACVVEFYPRGRETLALPYPVVSHASGEPVYENSTLDGLSKSIVCQAAVSQFPLLRTGLNIIQWKGVGNLQVTFEVNPLNGNPPVPPLVQATIPSLHFKTAAADRLWWQISLDPEFRLIPPNFDRTGDFVSKVTLSPLDETFLSAGGEYFVRARVRHDGTWSDWSRPVRFLVNKPKQPKIVQTEGVDGDQSRIHWTPSEGEMLIFGSNRIDFLPEIYGEVEATRIENGAICESRPNRNLLAVVPAKKGEVCVPIRACYRLIVREGKQLSVPSSLVRSSHVRSFVLQNRHEKSESALTGRDLAIEMQIP